MNNHPNLESLNSMLRNDRANIVFNEKLKSSKKVFSKRYGIIYFIYFKIRL